MSNYVPSKTVKPVRDGFILALFAVAGLMGCSAETPTDSYDAPVAVEQVETAEATSAE